MISKIKDKIKSTPLLKHSFIFLVGTTLVNIGNYVFNTIAGRMLDPAQFGVFNSVMSILYIITIATGALNLAVIKFASELTKDKDKPQLYSLFNQTTKKSFLWGAIICLIILLASPLIKIFLKLDSLIPIFIAAASALFSFTIIINRAFLQASLKFKELSLNLILEVIVKIVITIGFIFLGFKYNAPLLGFTIALVVTYLISFSSIYKKIFPAKKEYKKSRVEEFKLSKMIKYLFPTVISITGLTLFYSADVILVKHFFTSEEAGFYSILSLIGKIIFFSTAAIAGTTFPMVARNNKEGKPHLHLLKQSLLITTAISSIAVILYFIFPELIIKILFGSDYLAIASYLGIFGVIFSILSLCNVFINYYLSLNHRKITLTPLIGSLLMITLIFFMHDSLTQIAISMLISLGATLITYIIYSFAIINRKDKPRIPEKQII